MPFLPATMHIGGNLDNAVSPGKEKQIIGGGNAMRNRLR
jgi:hypothetical protein